jgi:hypothetical protein
MSSIQTKVLLNAAAQDNVWHATAFAQGKRVNVAVDAQGDIVAKGSPPEDGTEAAAQSRPASTHIERGGRDRAALLVWTFLLIGNALGLFILSAMTSGGSSAMATRTTPAPFV